MCDKEQYPAESEAREAAAGMGREHNKSMHHYWCVLCECWHVASHGVRKKLKRNNTKYPFRYQPKLKPVLTNNKKRKK